jgi:hypothetical protein
VAIETPFTVCVLVEALPRDVAAIEVEGHMAVNVLVKPWFPGTGYIGSFLPATGQ